MEVLKMAPSDFALYVTEKLGYYLWYRQRIKEKMELLFFQKKGGNMCFSNNYDFFMEAIDSYFKTIILISF